jgi:uncharacterized membrane protein
MRRAPVVTLALFVLPPWSQARADVVICNDFRAAIKAAIAHEDKGSFTSEGWWRVEPNACRDVPFSGVDFFYTAESDKYRDGGAQKQDSWGKGRQFHVGTGAGTFKLENAERSRRGARARQFTKVTIDERFRTQPFIATLRFKSGSTSVEVKRK